MGKNGMVVKRGRPRLSRGVFRSGGIAILDVIPIVDTIKRGKGVWKNGI